MSAQSVLLLFLNGGGKGNFFPACLLSLSLGHSSTKMLLLSFSDSKTHII